MGEIPKTHQERARDAAVRVIGEAASDEERDAVAQETFPAELAGAALRLADRLDEIMTHPSYENVFTMAAVRGNPYSGPSWEQPLGDLRDALALYEDKP